MLLEQALARDQRAIAILKARAEGIDMTPTECAGYRNVLLRDLAAQIREWKPRITDTAIAHVVESILLGRTDCPDRTRLEERLDNADKLKLRAAVEQVREWIDTPGRNLKWRRVWDIVRKEPTRSI